MSWFKKRFRAVTKATHSVSKFAGKAVKQADITSSRTVIGKLAAPVARQALGSAAILVTGGAAAINPKLRRWGIDGFKTGAVVGGALATGGIMAAGLASATQMVKAYTPPPEMEPSKAIEDAAEQNENQEVAKSTVTPGPSISYTASQSKGILDTILEFLGFE